MMDFMDVVVECAGNEDLVREFNRIYGCNLGKSTRRSPIEIMIDRACNYDGATRESNEDMRKFVAFVYDCVWCRLPPEVFIAIG